MDIFEFRDSLIEDFKAFSRSFTDINSKDIREAIEREYDQESRYWPDPLLQINPNYERAGNIDDLAKSGNLHPKCSRIFRFGNSPLSLYTHQRLAISLAQSNESYVVTTGTGSGKSLSFFIPIVDRILKEKEIDQKQRIRAIIIYPMNALANSQLEEINKFLSNAPDCGVTVGRYTGQEDMDQRAKLKKNPPDILLTNYMMLELMLMRQDDREVIEACQGLEFLVLDELHTYRGRQGADVALLVRRLRTQFNTGDKLICIGTSATMSSGGSSQNQRKTVARVVSTLFGTAISPDNVIQESLQRTTSPKLAIAGIKPQLKEAVKLAASGHISIKTKEDFLVNPLAVWLELTLSIEKTPKENNKRAQPKSVQEIIAKLADDSGCTEEESKSALLTFLQRYGENSPFKDDNPPANFAFKLHQFISGPGVVYLTLEAPGKRTITLDGQTTIKVADGKERPLFTAYFCRECGQEYMPVWSTESGNKLISVTPRDIDEIPLKGEDVNFGFVCPREDFHKFDGDPESLPDDWKEIKHKKSGDELVIRSNRKKSVPESSL